LSSFGAEFGDEAVTAYSPRLAALATSSAAYTTLSDDAGTGTLVLLGIYFYLRKYFILLIIFFLSAVYGTTLSRRTETRQRSDASNGT
jgi:hypothetical protein